MLASSDGWFLEMLLGLKLDSTRRTSTITWFVFGGTESVLYTGRRLKKQENLYIAEFYWENEII